MQEKTNVPLVSAIVPAYNEAAHIEMCLTSLKNQTYPRIEIICVDDGSTDTTKTIASLYADFVISLTHQGPAHARNTGANRAKGDILLLLMQTHILTQGMLPTSPNHFSFITKKQHIPYMKR